MKRLYSYISFILLFSCQSLFAQFPEKDRTEVIDGFILLRNSYTGSNYGGNMKFGHLIDVPIKYCFINCFGEIYLWISQYPRKIKSSGYYKYEGTSYEISEYVPSFNIDTYDNFSPYIDLEVIVTVGIYGTRVAEVKVTNLISWDFGGCLGQSIPLVDDGETKTKNGWSNQDILPYLKKLKISRMLITEGHSRDYEIEEAIRQKLFEEKNKVKQNQIDSFYNEYIKEANAILAQKDYEKAKAKFKQASDLKRNESYPISKIAAIDKILDEQKNEIKFNNLVADGDRFTASDKKTEARTVYREALKINPNNTIVQSKLDALGKDEIGDALEQVKSMTNELQIYQDAFSQRSWEPDFFSFNGKRYYTDYWKEQTIRQLFNYNGSTIKINIVDPGDLKKVYDDGQVKYEHYDGVNSVSFELSDVYNIAGLSKSEIRSDDYKEIYIQAKGLIAEQRLIVRASQVDKVVSLLKKAAIAAGANLKN